MGVPDLYPSFYSCTHPTPQTRAEASGSLSRCGVAEETSLLQCLHRYASAPFSCLDVIETVSGLIIHIFPIPETHIGCGRKRSESDVQSAAATLHHQQQMQSAPHQPFPLHPPQPNALNGLDDTLGDLLDLNSEPAVEDLMRQIMSQAKMWEAIQEANREMIIQKNDRSNMMADRPTGGVGFPTVQFNSQ